MNDNKAQDLLKSNLGCSDSDKEKLFKFVELLLEYNEKYNLISKNTEHKIWSRHILDSAQLIKYIDVQSNGVLADLGSGAGFPGLVISILNKNPMFHVKLYEKSPVKRDFLNKVKKNLDINFKLEDNVYEGEIDADYIVCRAFKKLGEIIKISREISKKPHKIIILKGKKAQDELNNISLDKNYSYKLVKSITDIDSKIIIFDVKVNEK